MTVTPRLPRQRLYAITGASGYIGRAFAERLVRDGAAVRGLSRRALPFDHVAGDVRDRIAVRRLVQGADVVVHLAAYVHRTDDGRECWSVNVDGTRNVVETVAECAPNAFLIFVSSASVYGPNDAAVDERAPVSPTTAYGRSKLEAERIVIGAASARRIRGCVLRPAIVFGAGSPGNLQKLVKMVRSGFVVEFDGGAQRKSLVPIETMIASILAVAGAGDAVNGHTFNVSGGAPLTMHTIIDIIARSSGKKPLRVSLPSAFLRPIVPPRLRRLMDAYSSPSILDDSKLRTMTGFEPPIAAEDALTAMIAAPRER